MALLAGSSAIERFQLDLFIFLMHAVGVIVNYLVVQPIPNERNLLFNQNLNTLSSSQRTVEQASFFFL